MVAIAAFVGTAALAVVLARVPGSRVTALSSDVAGPACAAPGLEAWLGLGSASTGGASTGGASTGGASTGGASTGGAGAGVSHGGGTYYTLEFTNVSRRSCRLYGYPEVSAYQGAPAAGRGPAAGVQIGGPAVRDTSVRPEPVVLAPGATAHAVLRVVVTSRTRLADCTRVTAGELRVALPSQGRAAFVPAHIPVCPAKGSVSLSVQAIQARAGVPGHAAMP